MTREEFAGRVRKLMDGSRQMATTYSNLADSFPNLITRAMVRKMSLDHRHHVASAREVLEILAKE